MARKKIQKDTDFASGFFSNPNSSESSEKIAAPVIPISSESDSNTQEISSKSDPDVQAPVKKHPGGRPKKEGLKNIQVSLTIPPELYEKLRIVSEQYTDSNFSRFVIECVKFFCRENEINLDDIVIPDTILDLRKEQQQKKK